jgi:hypothetical protein
MPVSGGIGGFEDGDPLLHLDPTGQGMKVWDPGYQGYKLDQVLW